MAHRTLWSPDQIRIQRLSPDVHSRKVGSGRLGSPFQEAGAKYVLAPGNITTAFRTGTARSIPTMPKTMDQSATWTATSSRRWKKSALKLASLIIPPSISILSPSSSSDEYDPKWANFYNVADRSETARIKFMHDWVAKRIETIDKYHPECSGLT